MPSFFKIISRAYAHTKNHKFLWFFGFFLTGGSVVNLARYPDIHSRNISEAVRGGWQFLSNHPVYFSASLSGFVISVIILFIVVSTAKAAILGATTSLENKEQISFGGVLKKNVKFTWRLTAISLAINFATFIVLAWMAAPVVYLFYIGLDLKAFILLIVAVCIAFPLVIIVSLVNILASCFVVVFNMHFKDALKSAFDLFFRFWTRAVAMFFIIFLAYFLLFFAGIALAGAVSLLALGLSFLIKSLSVPYVLAVTAVMVTVLIMFLVFLVLLAVSVLNVFTNICWTLFFLDIVKANKLPEDAQARPARVSAV